MGKSKRKTNFKKRKKSIWFWKNNKKAALSNQYRKIKEKIKKTQKTPLSKLDLLSLLKNVPHFLGVFSVDSLKFLAVRKFPTFLIINLDISTQPGSHWLSIRIGKFTLEIFDSLGFKPSLWNRYPTELFKFLTSYSFSHKFYFSPVLQPENTLTCGLFSVYFIVYRQQISFNQCISEFYKNLTLNNSKLSNLLLNY
jgi:hypothetical protein